MTRRGAAVIVGIFSMGLIILSVLNVGHWLSAPGNVPIKGDIIVALGGGSIERVQSAHKLYREGSAKRILITGLNRTTGIATNHYLHWESRILIDGGVPPEALLFDDQSGNSHDEASNTAGLMKT